MSKLNLDFNFLCLTSRHCKLCLVTTVNSLVSCVHTHTSTLLRPWFIAPLKGHLRASRFMLAVTQELIKTYFIRCFWQEFPQLSHSSPSPFPSNFSCIQLNKWLLKLLVMYLKEAWASRPMETVHIPDMQRLARRDPTESDRRVETILTSLNHSLWWIECF